MPLEWDSYDYYIQLGRTDMRKKAYTLSLLVENEMELSPFDRSVFLFCSRTKRILKIIVWGGNGFWEMTKRLEGKGTFAWPGSTEDALKTSLDDIKLLLKGADPWRRLTVLHLQKVS